MRALKTNLPMTLACVAACVALALFVFEQPPDPLPPATAAPQAQVEQFEVTLPTQAAAGSSQVLQLPEDGEVWHTSVFVHQDWRNRQVDRALVSMFETDPALKRLKAQTKWHFYTNADPYYRERFAQHCPNLPAVMVQRGNGEVIFHESAQALDPLPMLPAALIQKIEGWRCDGRRCYPVQPQPAPDNQSTPRPRFDPPQFGTVLKRNLEPIPDLPRGLFLDMVGIITRWQVWGMIAVITAGVMAVVMWRKTTGQTPVRRRRTKTRSTKARSKKR